MRDEPVCVYAPTYQRGYEWARRHGIPRNRLVVLDRPDKVAGRRGEIFHAGLDGDTEDDPTFKEIMRHIAAGVLRWSESNRPPGPAIYNRRIKPVATAAEWLDGELARVA